MGGHQRSGCCCTRPLPAASCHQDSTACFARHSRCLPLLVTSGMTFKKKVVLLGAGKFPVLLPQAWHVDGSTLPHRHIWHADSKQRSTSRACPTTGGQQAARCCLPWAVYKQSCQGNTVPGASLKPPHHSLTAALAGQRRMLFMCGGHARACTLWVPAACRVMAAGPAGSPACCWHSASIATKRKCSVVSSSPVLELTLRTRHRLVQLA